jgi:hypothetical protein
VVILPAKHPWRAQTCFALCAHAGQDARAPSSRRWLWKPSSFTAIIYATLDPFGIINFMRAGRTQINLLIHLVWPVLLAAPLVIQPTVTSQNTQQANQQQRPRTVGANQNTNQQPNKQPANSSEEVDEGDVVRVDTQLVTVPAIVTDKSGHPMPTFASGKLRLV